MEFATIAFPETDGSYQVADGRKKQPRITRIAQIRLEIGRK
jgi:hypothetical protein